MKTYLLFFLLLMAAHVLAGNEPRPAADSVSPKIITKTRLALLIDSMFEVEDLKPGDIELLNYYASLLKLSQCDSITLSPFNLHQLSFYSEKDESVLFPAVSLNEIPRAQHLYLENEHLSFYSAPVAGMITSHYGWREGRLHKGIDIDLNKGDRIVSAFSGKVRFAGRQGGFGNVVIIMHPNGLETLYAHLSRIRVRQGQVVHSGQTIGLGGSTGHSSGSHLHFEIRYKGHPLNPGNLISFAEKKLHHPSMLLRNTGQSLCAYPANSRLHKVHKGESWYVIAGRYGLSLKQLLALNGLSRRYPLKPGQEIRVN